MESNRWKRKRVAPCANSRPSLRVLRATVMRASASPSASISTVRSSARTPSSKASYRSFSGRHAIGRLPRLLTPSRAAFKQRIGALADLAPDLLPYNAELIELLGEYKRTGRKIVLATAADERIARAIADHLGLFDDVIASDGVRNLKGEAKARELVRRYGHKGFDYVGDSRADLAVWREADGIVIVNASQVVTRAARSLGNVIAEIDNRHSLVLATMRAIRPHQWVKNLLVFVPLLASGSFADWSGMIGALAMFASLLRGGLGDLFAKRPHGSCSGSTSPPKMLSAFRKRHDALAIRSCSCGRAHGHRARACAIGRGGFPAVGLRGHINRLLTGVQAVSAA